jgi:hypothetical protein
MDQTKIAQVLRDGATALVQVSHERDHLAQENTKLASEVKSLRLRMEAEKVAMDMHDKGVHTSVSFEDLTDQLEKKAHQDPHGFEVLREALNITGPDMLKTAAVGTNVSASTGSDFERYIIGDIG